MQLSRARRLSSASTVYHGASGMSVWTNISSFAREYSTHRVRDSRSIGDSFQLLIGSFILEAKRRSCSSSLTENQYLISRIPSSTSIRSKTGHWWRKRRYSSGVQNPITRSTPARLYQLRSRRTISPAAGRWETYRWKYHWERSRSVGAGSATMRADRGLRYSAILLMTPPLPAASRPSKTTTTRSPSWRTDSLSLTSSACRSRKSRARRLSWGAWCGGHAWCLHRPWPCAWPIWGTADSARRMCLRLVRSIRCVPPRLLGLCAVLLLAMACSASDSNGTTVAGTETQTTTAGAATTIETATTVAGTATTAGAAGGDTDGGLLILDGSGNVVVQTPDGSGSNQITDDAGPDQVYLQPTWSPAGDRVVVTSLTAEGSTILVVPLDGEPIPTATDFAPFFTNGARQAITSPSWEPPSKVASRWGCSMPPRELLKRSTPGSPTTSIGRPMAPGSLPTSARTGSI